MGRPVTTTKGKDWTSFLVEVNLRTPADLGVKADQCILSFQAEDGIGKLPDEIDIDDELELASSGSYTSDEYAGQLRFYYTGDLSGAKDRAFFSIRVACEGLKSQVVRIGVEKSWSSYLDLTLSTESKEVVD